MAFEGRFVFAMLLLSPLYKGTALVYSRLLPGVVVVSKRAHVWEFPLLFSLASVLKIIFNPSGAKEAGTGSVCSVGASTLLQDLPGHRVEIHSAPGDR